MAETQGMTDWPTALSEHEGEITGDGIVSRIVHSPMARTLRQAHAAPSPRHFLPLFLLGMCALGIVLGTSIVW